MGASGHRVPSRRDLPDEDMDGNHDGFAFAALVKVRTRRTCTARMARPALRHDERVTVCTTRVRDGILVLRRLAEARGKIRRGAHFLQDFTALSALIDD